MRQFSIALLAAALLATGRAGAADPTVLIRNDAFSPQTLTIRVGQTVEFANRDDDAHTVTAVDGSFDSKGLDTNGFWRHAFTRPGTYAYFCALHPFMKGTIVVKAATR